jgi:hypothetical protein
MAQINMYNIHYNLTRLVGKSGGNTDDMIEFMDTKGCIFSGQVHEGTIAVCSEGNGFLKNRLHKEDI